MSKEQTRSPYSTFLDDGITRRGVIEPRPGLHSGLEFEFRPMLPEQVAEMDETIKRLGSPPTGKQAESYRYMATRLAEQITTWNVRTAKNEPVAISGASLRRLNIRILEKLRWIISGIDEAIEQLGDDASEQERLDWEAEAKAQADGKLPGVEVIAASSGN